MRKRKKYMENERYFFERLKKMCRSRAMNDWNEKSRTCPSSFNTSLEPSLNSNVHSYRPDLESFVQLVSWFGFLVFKSTLRQSKAWIKGLKGTVVNRWCLSENTGSHKSLTIASWNRMTPSAVCLADSSVGGSGERHSFLTSEQRFNYSLTQSLEDNERIYKMSSWLFSINLSICKINLKNGLSK